MPARRAASEAFCLQLLIRSVRYALSNADSAFERLDYDAISPAPQDPDLSELDPSASLDVDDIQTRMVRAALRIAQPDGWIPVIGSSPAQNLRDYQSSVLGDYAAMDMPAARELRFLRSGGTEGDAPAERLSVFPDAGVVTMHGSFDAPFARQTHIVFNTGGPYHAHSHADALAVHLYGADPRRPNAGMPLLVDAGWFSYVDSRRHYFESTAAHNTVTVDGANQCMREPRGARAHPDVERPLASCEQVRSAAARASSPTSPGALAGGTALGLTVEREGLLYQSARHGLYRGVTHRRAVAMLGSDVIIVLDELAADRTATFQQAWHANPRVPAPPTTVAEGDVLRVVFAGDPNTRAPLFSLHQPLAVGTTWRIAQGWHSTTENLREPTQVVELSSRGASATFASVFLLRELAAVTPHVELLAPSGEIRAVVLQLPGEAPRTLVVENIAAGAPGERVRRH